MPNRWIRESCRTSKNLARLSDRAERLFWRLTTCADDYGRFIADAEVVKALCFPYRAKYLLSFVKHDLQELVIHRLVKLYTVKDRWYGQFCTWVEHQGIPRAKYSKYPDFPTETQNLLTDVNNSALCKVETDMPASAPKTDSDLHSLSSLIPKKGRESERGETAFEQFWAVYPRKIGKGAARKAWAKCGATAGLLVRICDQVRAATQTEQWQRDGGKYIPLPATWLSQSRWEDDYSQRTPVHQEGILDRMAKIARGQS